MRTPRILLATVLTGLLLPAAGCSAIVAVGDAVITAGATVVKVGAKAVGAAVDLVTPSSDTKKE